MKKAGDCDQVGVLLIDPLTSNTPTFMWWHLTFDKTKTSYLSKENKV